jgi:hypothetical protein
MAQIDWAGDVSGNFGTAADWKGGVVPGASDDAILNAAGATKYNVTVTTTGVVNSIQTAATATLLVDVGSAAGGFEATAGSGSGVNAGAISIAGGGDFIFGGTLDNTGKVLLSAKTVATELTVAGSASLTGVGSVALTDSADNEIVGQAAGATLTNAGNVIYGAGTIGGGNLSLVNSTKGKIDASGANALILSAAKLTNTATLEATNAKALTVTGGLTLDGETIANVGGVIEASGAHTHVDLESTAITGGVLKTAAGGVIDTLDSGSSLTGVTSAVDLEGEFSIGDGMALAINGVIDAVKADAGEIVLAGSGATTQLVVGASGAKLEGSGQIVMSDNAGNEIDASAAATFTNLAGTISGAGTIGGGGLVLVNGATGVIDATGTANALVLDTGANSIANSGIIEATGLGGLTIDSNVRNAATGKIELLDGASMSLNNATVTNGSLVVGSGSDLDLSNFNLNGVTLTTEGTGVITTDGGELDTKAVLAANFDVTPGTDLYVAGVVDDSGVISMVTNFESENGTQIRLKGSTTFEGGGGVYMGGSVSGQNFIDGNANPTVSGKATGYVLTNVDDTISGAGNLGIGGLGLGWLTIVNDAAGVIDGSSNTSQLVLSTGNNSTIVNAGTIEGSGAAGLLVSAFIANTGTILAVNGGVVDLSNNTVIDGGKAATSGTGAIVIDGGADFTNVDNTGNVAIGDGDVLYIGGSLVNSGTITLAGQGHGANLQLAGNVTLTGGGDIVLGGAAPWNDDLDGDFYAPGGTLVNVDDTISGGGNIGGGNPLPFTNDASGVIDASSTYGAMTLDVAGGGSITNLGLIEATGSQGMVIDTQVIDTGGTILSATGSKITLNGNANIDGGDVESAGTGVILSIAASFTNVTDSAKVEINDGYSLTIGGSLDNTGTIAMAGYGHGANLDISGTVFLTGGGHVVMGGTAPWNDSINGGVLINVDNTISGGGTIGNGGGGFTNTAAGVVDTNNVAGPLTFDTGNAVTLVNQGLIEATGKGGVDIISTPLDNTGGILLAATGSTIQMNSSEITGGSIRTSGTGVVDIVGYSTSWTGLSSSAQVYIGDGPDLYLSGLITNTGTITLNNAGHGGGLRVGGGTATLSGAGLILMDGTGGSSIQGAGALVNKQTIRGAGSIDLDFTNSGVVDGSTSGANITFRMPGTYLIANTGLIEATGGGGINIVQTGVDNAGGTILAAAGSTVSINNSEIEGGVLESSGTGVIDINGYPSHWTNLTNAANVYDGDGPQLYLTGLITNTGTISMAQGGHGGGLRVTSSATLAGTGAIVMGGTGPWNDSIGGGGKLTNEQTIMGAGVVGNGLTLNNAAGGVIEASNSLTTLDINAISLTNEGVLGSIDGDTLTINVAVTNTGTIESAGGDTQVNAGLSGAGKLVVDGGALTLSTGGAVAEATTFDAAGGTLQLDQATSFTGRVTGFTATGSTTFDLRDIGFNSAGEATFKENAAKTEGTLTVTDGTNTASFILLGNFSGDTFVASSDGSGGTDVVAEVTPGPAASPARLVAAMASMRPGGGSVTAATALISPTHTPLLAAHG